MGKTDIQFIIILAVLLAFGAPLTLQAQVGIGTELPDASAQLEISADGKGVLIPRMVEANRPATPATGLLIYQTDGQPGFYYYTGTAWQKLDASENPFTSTVEYDVREVASYLKGQVVTYDGSAYVTTKASPVGVPDTSLDYIVIAAKGEAGLQGPAGSSGAIIPFSSGNPIVMTTIVGGLVGTSAALGFGNSASGLSFTGSNIDLTYTPNMAFSVPRSGTITSVSASFSASTAMSLIGITLTVSAQLYQAAAGDNVFAPIPGAVVTMAPYTGLISVGDMVSDIASNLSIGVTAGSRLLLVFSSGASGLNLLNTVTGYASAGVAIN